MWKNISTSEFHLYLLLINNFHNKHDFFFRNLLDFQVVATAVMNWEGKKKKKKLSSLPGAGAFQFSLSMQVLTPARTPPRVLQWQSIKSLSHFMSLTDEASAGTHLIWPGCHSPFCSLQGNEVHFQASVGHGVIGLSKAFSLNLLKLYLFFRELCVNSWWTERQKNEAK